jgi:hypothetical protein
MQLPPFIPVLHNVHNPTSSNMSIILSFGAGGESIWGLAVASKHQSTGVYTQATEKRSSRKLIFKNIDPACAFTWNAIVDARERALKFASRAEERAREAS